MTQEIIQKQEPTSISEQDTFETIKVELQENVNALKSLLSPKASTAKIIANLQECPCLLRCVHEIQCYVYCDIDSLYSAKHEYAKTKMIEAIRDKFSDLITITPANIH